MDLGLNDSSLLNLFQKVGTSLPVSVVGSLRVLCVVPCDSGGGPLCKLNICLQFGAAAKFFFPKLLESLRPSDVLWVGEGHPTDTPYNISFIQNNIFKQLKIVQ